ncbi:protein SMALL AUXIN UP-REGULATED RNA 10-like isoform X2 [Amaranthus tricolor]|uniref:protein SMALL AUXIN UP-REGULATED RNA 10-like isoform X2 n=1 Tax=Amaranthus tricolor TaxID=29722 RepID=UPI00259020BA|nr:protein SMALL AUXIN UP-REGULATED RNA 10-like isoform X2 [Amaranthus tricolor]
MPPPSHISRQFDDAHHHKLNPLISSNGDSQSQIVPKGKAMNEYGVAKNGRVKIRGIRQIVSFKEMIRKWKEVTLNTQLKNLNTEDSDEEDCNNSNYPPDVPEGKLAVYVGPEHRRFVIPTTYLKHDHFIKLLKKVEDEYGFDHGNNLHIPCEIETFKFLIICIENEIRAKEDVKNKCNMGRAKASTSKA